jgi:hypothetical protein
MQVLSAARGVQEEFGHVIQVLQSPIEDQRPDSLTCLRAPRLTGLDDLVPLRAQPVAQDLALGARAGTVGAFKDDE